MDKPSGQDDARAAIGPEQAGDIAFQKRMFDVSCGDRIEEIEKVFRFSLDELPTIDRGVVTRHPVDFGHELTFQLNDGREILLTGLHQYRSYGGYLEGMPHPYIAFRQALDTARAKFSWEDATPIVLPPVKYVGTYVQDDFRSDWMTVPLVCCIACFSSNLPAKDSTRTNSDALVIWFQDRFGLDLDARTLAQLQAMDWNAGAMDWDY